jgi:hypothetical protein
MHCRQIAFGSGKAEIGAPTAAIEGSECTAVDSTMDSKNHRFVIDTTYQ